MNKSLKTTLTISGACVCAGLLAFGVLSSLIQRRPAEEVTEPREATLSREALALVEPAAATVGWMFRAIAASTDDPESGRATRAKVEFLGAVGHCPAESGRGGQALGTDTATGTALAFREARICVPGCVGMTPPAARTLSTAGRLEMTAFQDEFDRPIGEYAPQGAAAVVDWQCAGSAGRVVAAAVVALACNTDECGDEQRANASVYIASEQGKQLAAPRAIFSLRSTGNLPVLGAVALR